MVFFVFAGFTSAVLASCAGEDVEDWLVHVSRTDSPCMAPSAGNTWYYETCAAGECGVGTCKDKCSAEEKCNFVVGGPRTGCTFWEKCTQNPEDTSSFGMLTWRKICKGFTCTCKNGVLGHQRTCTGEERPNCATCDAGYFKWGQTCSKASCKRASQCSNYPDETECWKQRANGCEWRPNNWKQAERSGAFGRCRRNKICRKGAANREGSAKIEVSDPKVAPAVTRDPVNGIELVSTSCLDARFVVTCVRTFIKGGGCDLDPTNDEIVDLMHPECFACDHIDTIVEQECKGLIAPKRTINSDLH